MRLHLARRLWIAAALLPLGLVVLPRLGAAQTSVPNIVTYDYGNNRSGDDPETGTITGLSTNPTWAKGLDGAVYGEPLVYDNEVVVATENDSVYGLNITTGKVLWRDHVGTAVRTSVIDTATGLYNGCGDIDPLGITGTSVIDLSRHEVYVTTETMDGATRWQDIRHDLVGVSLSSHKTLFTRDIDPPGANTAKGYVIPALQQRPALTFANGKIYVGFGGLAGDCGQYHGYEVDVPVSGKGTEQVFKVPTQTEGAIWATNGALVNAHGDLYVATGNGSSNSTYDGGDSLYELTPNLTVIGNWAPSNWATLNDQDWDLGSAGPISIPGTSSIFIAGKPASGSFGYLLTGGSLGHGPGSPDYTGSVCSDGSAGVFGADAVDAVTSPSAETFIYAACGSGTEALLYNPAGPTFTQAWTASNYDPNGPPIVADGEVLALDWNDNVLVVMNPLTGHVDYSSSTAGLNHFATPTVDGAFALVPTARGLQAFHLRLS